VRARVKAEVLDAYLADTVKTRLMQPDGTYTKAGGAAEHREMQSFSAQDFLIAVAEGRETASAIPHTRFSLISAPDTAVSTGPPIDTSAPAATKLAAAPPRKPRKRKSPRADA
jgi:hypothetical protein